MHDTTQDAINGTIIQDHAMGSKAMRGERSSIPAKANINATNVESELDNFLPSIMTMNNKLEVEQTLQNTPRVGKVGKRAIGLSSSVLLPLSDGSVAMRRNEKGLSEITNNSNNNNHLAKTTTSWKERLVDFSNIASLLCVLDCTLLPLVSIAVPALSWIAGWIVGVTGTLATSVGSTTTATSSVMAGLSSVLSVLPAIGHGIALYFVIPVGLLTTVVNYLFGHKKVRFTVPALLGVILIFVANSSHGVGIASVDAFLNSWGVVAQDHVHGACGAAVEGVGHLVCSEGWAHRMTNTLGCAFVLGSNYASRKFLEDKSKGCAAIALAEAWGGERGRIITCPPGCNCERPSYGTSETSGSSMGGDMFFQWERERSRGKPGADSSGGRPKPLGSFKRFRR